MKKIFFTIMIVALFSVVVFAGSRDGSARNRANSFYGQANASYNLEDSPYNPKNSPYNPQNSPYNWDNSPYNPANSPYNPANSPYNPANSPYDPQNSPYNPTRAANAFEEGSGGYSVARPGGGSNIFDDKGNLVGYTTQSGQVHPIADQAGTAILKPNKILMNNQTQETGSRNTDEENSEEEREKEVFRGIWDSAPGLRWNASE